MRRSFLSNLFYSNRFGWARFMGAGFAVVD